MRGCGTKMLKPLNAPYRIDTPRGLSW
jgi:hypothetical protein